MSFFEHLLESLRKEFKKILGPKPGRFEDLRGPASPEFPDRKLEEAERRLARWRFIPNGTEGLRQG